MSSAISRTFRYIRSFIPVAFATKEERLNFVKYSNSENEKELSVFANGTANCELADAALQNEKSDSNAKDVEVDGTDKRNHISEWQAGWNVTNAIQVVI